MLRIAVVLDQVMNMGGGYQQSLSTIKLFEEKGTEYQFIYITTHKDNLQILSSLGVEHHFLDMSLHQDIMQNQQKYIKRAYRSRKYPFLYKKYRSFLTKEGQFIDSLFDQACYQLDIDLVYFLSPTHLAQMSKLHNFMVCVWDLCHRDFPEFPEVSNSFVFESRELMYHNIIPKAFRVIADSETGKKNMVRIYRNQPERVLVAPFFPSHEVAVTEDWYNKNKVDVKSLMGVQGDYIFYPAQFWAHKNHVYILEALQEMNRSSKTAVHAIFTGSDKGNLGYIKNCVQTMGLSDQVHFPGFVETNVMISLYKQALALVMPSYFGPTNLPPLEAFALGCPVIYSDMPQMYEQVKGAVLLVDLNKPESLSSAILKLKKNKAMRNKLTRAGQKKLALYTPEKYWQQVESAFKDYSQKIKTWKNINR